MSAYDQFLTETKTKVPTGAPKVVPPSVGDKTQPDTAPVVTSAYDRFRQETSPSSVPRATVVTPQVEKSSVVSTVGTGVGKILDWFGKNKKQADEANFKMNELMTNMKVTKDPVTGKQKVGSNKIEAFDKGTPEEKAKLLDDYNQNTPLVKFLNSPTGKKITSTIAEKTSNIPLKLYAQVKALGDLTYEEVYKALEEKAKDPTNTTAEKIFYGVQDSGVQSLVAILAGLSVTALTRGKVSPVVVTTPIFASISADSQQQERGRVDSLGNIAIDTIGDNVLSGFAESALKGIIREGGETAIKRIFKNSAKGFGVEGSTEVAQSFLKYVNDYKNASSEEEKQGIVQEVTAYVKEGGMAQEFLIGGIAGGVITGGASAIGGKVDPNIVTKEEKALPIEQGSAFEKYATEKGVDLSKPAIEIQKDLENANAPKGSVPASGIAPLEGVNTKNEKRVSYDEATPIAEKAVTRYWSEKIQPAVDKGEPVVIGADDLKDYFGKDYNDNNHPIYSQSAFKLFELGLQRVKNKKLILTAGGAGAGKTEIITKQLTGQGFDGMIYDSNLANYEGVVKQIDKAKEAGFDVEIYGVLPDLERARSFTIQRENKIGRGISDATFARGHAGMPEVLAKLLQEGKIKESQVKILDTRDVKGKDDTETMTNAISKFVNEEYVTNVLDTLSKLRYNESNLKETYAKNNFDQTTGQRTKSKTSSVEGSSEVSIRYGGSEGNADGGNNREKVSRTSERKSKKQEVKTSKELDTTLQKEREKKIKELKKIALASGNLEEFENKVSTMESEYDFESVFQFHGTQQGEALRKAIVDGSVRASEQGLMGKGFYVTTSKESAEMFGKQTYDANRQARSSSNATPDIIPIDLTTLNIKEQDFGKGEYYDFLDENKLDADAYNEQLMAEGYDGLNLKGRGETILFYPSKVKLFDFAHFMSDVGGVDKNETTKKYATVHSGGEIKMVEGDPVEIVKGIETFLHKGDRRGFIVSEVSTGRFISEGETKKEAIDNAKANVKKVGKEALLKLLDRHKLVSKTPVVEESAKNGLVLEVQNKPKETESRTQTEVQGKKINRFSGQPQEKENPRVMGRLKPLLPKSGIKQLFNNDEFKANPVFVVEKEGRELFLAFTGKSSQFKIKPNALGLVVENLKEGQTITVDPETLKNGGQEMRVMDYSTGKGSRFASIGRYREEGDITTGRVDEIKAIQFPELLDLAKELSGNIPFIKKYTRANGMFYPRGTGDIGLNPDLFKEGNLGQLQKTFAHEIGHLIDYLPDQTMTRGNVLGRLSVLKGFNKDFYEGAGITRTNKELRAELWDLSKYWKPIDEATAPASFLSYRKSAPEVYADFISVLFNDPNLVAIKAPTAYNVFFEQLDKKPLVKKAYFELQDFLRYGDRVAKRRSATNQMFKLTEQQSRERQIQMQQELEEKERSVWFKFKTEMVDITEAVKEDVKRAQAEGKYINPDDNPTYYLEERNYLGGKIKSEVDTKFNNIYQELQKEGMAWEDLGELMFYERILKGDRGEVANPLGYQPDFVQELMDTYEDVGSVKPDTEAHKKGTSDMKSTLGESKYLKLQELAVQYRENLKGFFEEGRKEGIYSEDLAKLFEENAFYVPFKGAKYSGVSKTTFGVKQQKGTLGNIENPANTGIEKAVSIIRAIERNRVTRKTIEFYQENFGDEVVEAKRDQNGYPIPPKEDGQSLVTYMEDGKVKGFYVDSYIAEAIQKNTVAKQNQIIGAIRFFNSGLFRPLFITFNLGFQSFNLIRDFKRFWKNVPDMTILGAIKLYGKSVRASKIRAFGLPENPSPADQEAYDLINKLENDKVISITYNDIIKGENIEDAQIDRILRETGVREAKQTKLGNLGEKIGVTKETPIIKQAFQILDFIEKTGNMIETLPKVAGVFALEGKMPAIEMRSFVRKYVGSPDFLAGGRDKKSVNEILLFANAIAQGIRSDYTIATEPKSRGAYWWKTAQSELLPKALMLAVSAGLMGDWLKDLFDKVSEYDKANYTIIPLGEDENGKAIYFRMPSDETGRLIGGMFWKLANAIGSPEKLAELETYTDLLTYAGGQVPSVSPVVQLGAFTIPSFIAGNNPYDFFRGRPILTDEQQLAGGSERLKPFLSYMFQQMGGNVFMKLNYNETVPKNPSLSEKIVNLPVASNIAGRFIKVSNYGETEKLRSITDDIKQENARENIANRRVVFDYVDQARGKSYNEQQTIKREMIKTILGDTITTREERQKKQTLEKRFTTLLIRGEADPKVDLLITAQSNEEKVALLAEYQKTMTKEKFEELRQFIIKNKVVSSEAYRQFLVNNSQK